MQLNNLGVFGYINSIEVLDEALEGVSLGDFDRDGLDEVVIIGDNYLDIKKTYPNYKYLTNSDVAPILPLYKDLGERYVHQLNGMFAIAIYDSA